MNKELNQVKEFHEKFKVLINHEPTLINKERAKLRHSLMSEEVQEYANGAKNGDLENIAKELADILYTTYGTIIEHGLQDKMEDVFKAVHESNMSKDYHPLKVQKGKNYIAPDISKILKS